MGIETSFVAGYFHDGKKTLLNHDKTQTQTWGTWDPDHLRWDEPDTQGDIADLNFPFTNDDPILENKEQLLAIKLHQRVFSEKVLGFNLNQEEHQSEILKLDQVALLALLASDTLHKSFYQSASGLEDGPPSIMRCPFFLPFYAPGAEGRAIGWLPMDLPSDTRLPVHDLLPAAVGDAIQFRNARKLFKDLLHAIRHEKEKAINPAQFLTTRQMLKWQESFFSSFPDTTYLPITSLNFHHRFVAVLLLLVYQRLCKWRCETLQNPQEIAIPLCLNTIVCPPEVLTNRLRDTSLVRKISHRLQLRLHRYFHESQYLQPLQRFGFSHPDLIPFFFYNKDAIVLISGGADQEAIQAICREIAQKTESIITLNTIPIQAKVEMTFHKKVPEKGQGLDEINILDLMDLETRNDRVRVIGNACLGEPTSTPFLGIPKPDKTPKVESDGDAMEEAHCFACNKGVKKLFTDPFTDDRLCKRCHELRRQYRFCQVCNIYFQSLKPSQPADEPCVLCGGDADWSETTPFLRGGKEGTTPTNQEKTSDKEKVIPRIYRVAYVLIKTDASLEGVKLESEAQMSRFRHLRARFENPTNPKLIRKPAELADQEGLTAEDWKLLAKIDELLGQKTYTKNHLISELQHITGFKWELLKEKLDDYIGRGLLSDPKRLKQLVSMKPTRDTIFEYLQATLNMNQFQEDLKGQLRETLQEVQRRQANERHNFDGYPITDADWTDEALDQHVMYRSPTRTLLVMPEPALRLFYPKLLQLTQNLHLAHKLRIVACAHNTPVWWILHELKLVESEDYFSTDLKNASRDLRDLQTQLDPQTEEKNQILKVWEKSEQFRERYQQVVHPLNHISLSISETQGVKLSPRELTLTIIRGSSLRSFPNEIAHRLLTFVPLSNPNRTTDPARCHVNASWNCSCISQGNRESS
ncbi:hypothetical protein HYR99_08260 [Candidatus Poribacteria bacterium]|nr:hypothetical protein [Candidatus Poribacteria bacterium]